MRMVENQVGEGKVTRSFAILLFLKVIVSVCVLGAVKCGGVRPQLMPGASYAEQWGCSQQQGRSEKLQNQTNSQ